MSDPAAEADAADRRLVEAIRDASRPGAPPGARADAWTALLEAYEDRLFGVCMRMVRDPEVARDLTQDSMVKVLRGLDTYDGRARLSTWMIRVTMNVCLSHLRKQKLRRHASLEALGGAGGAGDMAKGPGSRGGEGAGEPAGVEGVERREAHAMVARALATLDPEHRQILILRDVQDLDYKDIAEALSVPVGTVKSRLFRAREALRNAMESLGGGNRPA